MASKYRYHLETKRDGEWIRLMWDAPSLEFWRGYLLGMQDIARMRPAARIVRSDGKVMEEVDPVDTVPIGMTAGFPTPEQYEAAADRAQEKAKRIRATMQYRERARKESDDAARRLAEIAEFVDRCAAFEPGDQFQQLVAEAGDVLRRPQVELAEELDAVPSTVSRWVSGEAKPDPRAQRQVVRTLKVLAQKEEDNTDGK